jgi:hypothetical protein
MKEIGPRKLRFTLTEEQAFEFPPPRRTLCPRYEECLEHAAGQFWISFTCRGCYLEALILAGRMKELSPPRISTTTFYTEFPICASMNSIDGI